jgi:hypothetical protein
LLFSALLGALGALGGSILDGIATAAHLSGKLGSFSMWWIELAILPMALLSIPILRWCYAIWHHTPTAIVHTVPEITAE